MLTSVLDFEKEIVTIEMSKVLYYHEMRLFMLGCRRAMGPAWISLFIDKGVTEIKVNHDQTEQLSRLSKELNKESPILGTIIVTASDILFGMSRVFQSYREVEGSDQNVGIFRTIEQATEYIKEIRDG